MAELLTGIWKQESRPQSKVDVTFQAPPLVICLYQLSSPKFSSLSKQHQHVGTNCSNLRARRRTLYIQATTHAISEPTFIQSGSSTGSRQLTLKAIAEEAVVRRGA